MAVSGFCQEQKKSEAGGPPTKSELIGFWKMVDFPARAKMNKEDPWPQPYQWFAFYENGKVSSMMTDIKADYSRKELEEIFAAFPPAMLPDYEYDGRFVRITNPDIADYMEIWGVNLFARDIGNNARKGDLMMSLDDGEGTPIYYRLLRRVE